MSSAAVAFARPGLGWSRGGDESFVANGDRTTKDAYDDTLRRFALSAKQLLDDAAAVSAPRRLMRHPAYLEILSMGEAAVPLLLQRLETQRGRPIWLSLLGLITVAPPGLGTETIDDAAEAWIRWGKRSGQMSRVRPDLHLIED